MVFREQVIDAMRRGDIKGQPDPSRPFYYPQEKFLNRKIGPNMHQVNMGLIKPITLAGDESSDFIPGLSYSLMMNYASGGLPCEVFFSHAWDEGVFELLDRAIVAWPPGCKGAYICCLSNPQNLNIGSLIGSRIDCSPFYRILTHAPPPKWFTMLANTNTPIHSRLWYAPIERASTHCQCVVHCCSVFLRILTHCCTGVSWKPTSLSASR